MLSDSIIRNRIKYHSNFFVTKQVLGILLEVNEKRMAFQNAWHHYR
jgi:hypothetical protein